MPSNRERVDQERAERLKDVLTFVDPAVVEKYSITLEPDHRGVDRLVIRPYNPRTRRGSGTVELSSL